MLSQDELLSKTIRFLRFPLIVGVVFIHSTADSAGQFPVYDWTRHIITDELARIAVPLLFFISGFLFFYRSDFSASVYKQKLKKRFFTLLIPYVFWNAVVLLPFLVHSCLTPAASPDQADFKEWTTLLDSFWSLWNKQPINYPLWFIRDLMMVVLCSPLVYYFVRYGKALGVALLGGLWAVCPVSLPGFSMVSFFFFSFGAWFSMNRRNFVTAFRPLLRPATVLYVFLLITSTFLWHYDVAHRHLVHNIGIMAGIVTAVAWSARGMERGVLRCRPTLADSSFFVFAYHELPLYAFFSLIGKLAAPATGAVKLMYYFCGPLLVILAGVGLYVLLKRCAPTFTKIITGGR